MKPSKEMKQKVLDLLAEHPEGLNTSEISEALDIPSITVRCIVYDLTDAGVLCVHTYLGHSCWRGGEYNILYCTLADNGDNREFRSRTLQWAVVDRIVDPRRTKVCLLDICRQNKTIRASEDLQRRLCVAEDVKRFPGITQDQIIAMYGVHAEFTIKQLVHLREIFYYKGGYYIENPREAKA